MSSPTESFAAYLALAALVTLTPGPNVALVIRTALDAGSTAGIRATLGVVIALVVWGLAAAFGVAAVLRASPQAFGILQAVGGVWLLYLGVMGLRAPAAAAPQGDAPPLRRRDFQAGLVTNLLNPLAGAFYLAALPGFVRAGPSAAVDVLLLAAVHIGMVLSWLSLCSVLVARGASVFGRSGSRTLVRRASAVALIVFGVRALALAAFPG